jgi:hypothetical protein
LRVCSSPIGGGFDRIGVFFSFPFPEKAFLNLENSVKTNSGLFHGLLGFLRENGKYRKGKHREIGKRRPPHQHAGTLSAHFIHTLPIPFITIHSSLCDPKEKGES